MLAIVKVYYCLYNKSVLYGGVNMRPRAWLGLICFLFIAILVYPYVLVREIVIFFKKLIYNILYGSNKTECTYDDIVGVIYTWEDEHINSIIVYEGENKRCGKRDDGVILNKNEFNKLKSLLKENRILQYKKYILKFRFPHIIEPFADGECIMDGPELKILFKNKQSFEITALCETKRFNNVTNYIKKIFEDTSEV